MRRSAKFMALVLSVLMFVSALAVGTSAAFTDVPANDEALKQAVSLLANLGITKGTTETTFGTNELVTRQQMAAFVYRLMKQGKSVEGGENNTTFTDLTDPTFYYMISWANEQEIITGRSDTVFDPKGNIILQDAYTMVIRALGYEKVNGKYKYPHGYMDLAEKIGLDENLPASINAETTLTRGNIAIILYNAFYADMATGEEVSRIIYDYREGVDEFGDPTLEQVEIGVEDYTEWDTIAKDIYGVEKTVQRVVATENYQLGGNELHKGSNEVLVTLEPIASNKEHKNDEALGAISLEELGLSGKSDDYFLADIEVYYKKDEDGKRIILSADSLLVKQEAVRNGLKLAVSTKANESGGSYGFSKTSFTESRFDTLTGAFTVGDMTGGFFNIPAKTYKKYNVGNDEREAFHSHLINLEADTSADPDEEDYTPSYNFGLDVDLWGRGAAEYANLTRKSFKDNGKSSDTLGNMYDDAFYNTWGIYEALGYIRVNTQHEVDAWDSNGDGFVDYVWVKPYTYGFVESDETTTLEAHNENSSVSDASELSRYAGIVDKADRSRVKIYTDGAHIVVPDGKVLKDGELIIAYVNGPANYIKYINSVDAKITSARPKDSRHDPIRLTNGQSIWDWQLTFFGILNSDGTSQTSLSTYKHSGSTWRWDGTNSGRLVLDSAFESKEDADFIYYSNTILWIDADSSGNYVEKDYAYLLPTHGDEYALIEPVIPTMTDGVAEKVAYYANVYTKGTEKSVPVRIITEKLATDDRPATPAIEGNKNKGYDFSEYVGKPLIAYRNADGEYYFDIVDFEAEIASEKSVLLDGNNKDLYYGFVSESDEFSGFVKSGKNYIFNKKGVSDMNPEIADFRVKLTDATKIVLRVYDEDEEEYVWEEYSKDNPPAFSKDTMIYNIQYVVRNNPASDVIEELIYLYGEIKSVEDAAMTNVIDLRIVKEVLTAMDPDDNDEEMALYDLFNPFTGETERQTETTENILDTDAVLGDIVLLSNKKVADDIDAGSIGVLGDMCTSEIKVRDIKNGSVSFGYDKVSEYDEEYGFIVLENTHGENSIDTFEVDENTIVSLIDLTKSEPEIKSVSKSVLASDSKVYNNVINGEKVMKVFISSAEIPTLDDEDEQYEKAVMILIIKDTPDSN